MVFRICLIAASAIAIAGAAPQFRYIAVTDLTHDDGNSLIRLLHYANDIDIEAIIISPQLPDNPYNSLAPWNKAQDIISAYGRVHSQLLKHDPAYPSVDRIRSITKKGRGGLPIIWTTNGQRVADWIGDGATPNGEPKDSEGSDFLQTVFAKDDPRPIMVGLWGGPITFSQALYRYNQKNTPQRVQQLLDKLFIYSINYQDITHDYFFNLALYERDSRVCQDRHWSWTPWNGARLVPARVIMEPGHFWKYVGSSVADQGAFGVYGDLSGKYDGGGEGDTPSMLHVISSIVGLNDPRNPEHGSWGNRFTPLPAEYPNAYSICDVPSSELDRWIPDTRNSFIARLQYAVKEPSQVNHAPVPALNGKSSAAIAYIPAKPGATIALDATGTSDRDNNALTYKWWQYREAGTYGGTVALTNVSTQKISITLPSDLGSKTIHIILEVRDNGVPSLVAYRRAVIGDGVSDPWKAPAATVSTATSANPKARVLPRACATQRRTFVDIRGRSVADKSRQPFIGYSVEHHRERNAPAVTP